MQTATQDRILGLASGEGEARWWFDGLATLKVTGEQSGGLFSLIEMLYPAGGVVPRHIHHREDELFYLMEGELVMRVGERTIQAKAGTTIFAPRGIPHGFQVGPNRPVHYLILYTPAGFEGFIRDTSTPAGGLTLPPPPDAPPTPSQMQELSDMMRDRYGCEWEADLSAT